MKTSRDNLMKILVESGLLSKSQQDDVLFRREKSPLGAAGAEEEEEDASNSVLVAVDEASAGGNRKTRVADAAAGTDEEEVVWNGKVGIPLRSRGPGLGLGRRLMMWIGGRMGGAMGTPDLVLRLLVTWESR